jgi:GNAT superfamily N-acetyltransferase
MTDIPIRAFVAADAEACVRIFERAWHAGHPYTPRKIDRAAFAAETKGERVFVAEAAGKVSGFVSLYEPKSFVHHLYVEPALQGYGIGKALLAHAVAHAGGSATLKCQLRNPQTLGFYRRPGWRDGETGEGDAGPWVRMISP